jgi:hypothetical protein
MPYNPALVRKDIQKTFGDTTGQTPYEKGMAKARSIVGNTWDRLTAPPKADVGASSGQAGAREDAAAIIEQAKETEDQILARQALEAKKAAESLALQRQAENMKKYGNKVSEPQVSGWINLE